MVEADVEEAGAGGEPRHGGHLAAQRVHKARPHAGTNVADGDNKACREQWMMESEQSMDGAQGKK
jgi:hypothetical protein